MRDWLLPQNCLQLRSLGMTEAASRFVTSCVSRELDENTTGILEVTRRFMYSLGYQTSSIYLLTFDAQQEGLEHMEQYTSEEAEATDSFVRVTSSIGQDSVWEEYINSERATREEWATDPRTASSRLQAMWEVKERTLHFRKVGYSLTLDGTMKRLIDYLAKLADYNNVMVELLNYEFEERKLFVRVSAPSLTEQKGAHVYIEVRWLEVGDLNKE